MEGMSQDVDSAPQPEPKDTAQVPRRRPARRAWRIALLASLSVVLVLTLAAAGLALWVRTSLAGNIETFADPFSSLTSRAPEQVVAEGSSPATNILLLGSDSRAVAADPSQWHVGAQRADAIMIVQISGDRQSMSVMSIPRDSWVEVPGQGQNKINAAYSLGGPSLMVATVEQLTGVRIDHVVIADFAALTRLTDEIGGVTINLASEQVLAGTTFPAGAQLLNGEQALAYTRERASLPGGDLDRVRRQQAWMRAIVSGALSADTVSNPVRLYSFLETVTSTLAVDEGLTIDTMQSLALSCRDLRVGDIAFMTVPVSGTGTSPDGQSIVVLDTAADAPLFEAFASDTVEDYLEANPGAVELLPATVD